jgi:FAD:protein FMN transferase
VSGARPGQTYWDVQLEDPAKKGRRTQIRLRDAAVSTSGDYENYFDIDGKRYAHILNPRTGLPIEGIAACSVIAPTCIESDALATAFFVLGPEDALAHFSAGYPMRFVLTNGQVAKSPDFP